MAENKAEQNAAKETETPKQSSKKEKPSQSTDTAKQTPGTSEMKAAAKKAPQKAGKAAERTGAAMVCLHPRTRSQGFSGRARVSELKELKTHCSVPVIGSGDLFSPEDALKVFRESGCDGLMFARGALGNPFIFTATKELLAGSDPGPAPTARLRLETVHALQT